MVIEMYFQAVIRAEHLQHNASLQEKMLGTSKPYVLARLVPSQPSRPSQTNHSFTLFLS